MELLSETELSEDQLPLLRTARTCGEQLSTVIDDILDLTKIQDKRIILSNEEFCFMELLEDLMDITVFSLNRRKIELILDFDESVPLHQKEKETCYIANALINRLLRG